VCLGYPLVGRGGTVRDAVLLELRTPVLFVQGTRDPLCPPAALQSVRRRMTAPSELYSVEDGDHSLNVPKSKLAARGLTPADIFERAVDAIGAFIERQVAP
jgi:predicted alpha/beta-hydrolase family hydrolase